ncbi:MarR family winged helix-turn-helix transcriptional regulator [Saccharopolyspora flava]|uniref:DNA-binding transcriptional regulator, MarR family n=1 Tax=Saccharopolyspora flava TaxID=95161 RepID=A0A1I6T050_9PSEU|nr:MarR family transcriptional regulator [Saccharopolyspora flava]SFS82655.1 DNA-binding transcriptional regulator, MarR family [Saccharopolyspora flava]
MDENSHTAQNGRDDRGAHHDATARGGVDRGGVEPEPAERDQADRSGVNRDDVDRSGADEALATMRAMVRIADATVAEVTGQLTLTQFRALVIIAEHSPPVIMGRVAEELAMNPSSATRACDRLVQLDLVQRARNPLNKRETLLAPTAGGREIVARVNHQRRTLLAEVLDRLDPATREAAIEAFTHFTAAAATTPL